MNMVKKITGKRKWLLTFSIILSTVSNAQLVTYPDGMNAGMLHNDVIRSESACREGSGKTCSSTMSV